MLDLNSFTVRKEKICPYQFVKFYHPGHIVDLNIGQYVTGSPVIHGIGSGPHKCA
jgi:hypothetical protein